MIDTQTNTSRLMFRQKINTKNSRSLEETSMKKTIYFLFALTLFVFVSAESKAQQYKPNYEFALGLQFGGYENGISGKYFLDNTTSLEGILGFRSHGVVVTGLYELNVNAFNTPGLQGYYGAGAHVGVVGAGV